MPCSIPLTLSTGYLFIRYSTTAATDTHTTRIRINKDEEPTDIPIMEIEALAISNLMAEILPVGGAVTGWGTMDPDASIVYETSWPSPIDGLHAAATGAEAYLSRTITITGRGRPNAAGECTGQARMVLFVGQAYNFAPGEKFKDANNAPEIFDLGTYLDGNSVVWSDYYGHEAGVRSRFPVQFNAATQRRRGQ